VLVGLAATSAIHNIEAILLIGLGALVMAVIGVGAVLAEKADQLLAVLKELRDRLPPRI